MTLVPVPWQPWLYLTPHTLSLFVAAGKRLGRNIIFNSVRSPTGSYLATWRSYSDAVYLWDQYLHHGGAPASNPDTGQRNHLRGAAGDIIGTDATTQAACRAVGLVRDPNEAWHWNDPQWPTMPIIASNPAAAGGGATPIGDDSMSAADVADLKAWMTAALYVPGQPYTWAQAANNSAAAAADALTKPSPASGQFRPIDVLVSQTVATLTAVNKLPTTASSGGTGTGASTQDIVAALKPLFDALPAAVRAAIIK